MSRKRSRMVVEEGPDADDGFYDPDDVRGPGVGARLMARLAANPAMTGGIFVIGLTAVAVISNAVFLQQGKHPKPWFATGPATADVQPLAEEIPVPRTRSDAIPALIASDDAGLATAEPIVSPEAAPKPPEPVAVPQAPPVAAETEQVDVRTLQEGLAARGLYSGAIDGIPGSRTRAAIVAFQEASGLPVTGVATPELIDQLTTASVDIPAPATRPAEPAGESVAPLPPQPVEPVTSASLETPTPEAVVSGETLASRNRLLAVQRALNRIGYGPVPENGEAGDATTDAIRRFELDNGLPVTGAPEDHVVERLVAIGALTAG